MSTDFLDSILEPKTPVDTRAAGHWLVAPARAKDSAEQEKVEAAMLEMAERYDLLDGCPLWPVPFYDESGRLEPLSDAEAKALKVTFGVTAEEYSELYNNGGQHGIED